ncbi:MAG: SAM-dependent chlorinase/fluorinase [Bacteroidales bacterium]|nr:SAM-dependent chlorinase/fluorinase [Bacteroidales bacterium]
METPIVTLTTDWGDDGLFVGMAKGMLYQHIAGVRVVDISHRIKKFSISDATFVVQHACTGFPEGTIHIIDVATRPPFLAVKALGQYFLCCDNGLPMMVLGEHIEEAYTLPTKENGVYNFAVLSVLARAAVNIANGVPMEHFAQKATQLQQSSIQRYMRFGEGYAVYVNYIDAYGNAYLGMSYREFEELREGRAFTLTVRDQEVEDISLGYYDQKSTDPRHRLQLTVSATGWLELAVREGSFQQLFGLKVREYVLLRFKARSGR